MNKIDKYIEKYGFKNYKLTLNSLDNIDHVVIIPVIAEYYYLNMLLISLKSMNRKYISSTLFLFIVNNTFTASSEIKQTNKKTLELLYSEMLLNVIRVGVIDASTLGNELPDDVGGVGLARKIGMDEAIKLFRNSDDLSKNLLICLDADCTVSLNYLTEIIDQHNKQNYNSAVVQYEHSIEGDEKNIPAIICYEIYLRYYSLQLKRSNSPFKYHTIGSTMISTIDTYIKAEGMNKRKAAEDFYFLNKISKFTDIIVLGDAFVYPSNRGSWRVPFGTGQRVNRFIQGKQDEYLLYNPIVFNILKEWHQVFYDTQWVSGEELLNKSLEINIHLFDFLKNRNLKDDFDNILNNSKSERQLYQQKKSWFDAFVTLKLVHVLRENYKDINMFKALNTVLDNQFVVDKKIISTELQIEMLKKAREKDYLVNPVFIA